MERTGLPINTLSRNILISGEYEPNFAAAIEHSVHEIQQAINELRDDIQRLFQEFQHETRTMLLTFFEHAGMRIPLCIPTLDDPALPRVDVDIRPATQDAHTLSCLHRYQGIPTYALLMEPGSARFKHAFEELNH